MAEGQGVNPHMGNLSGQNFANTAPKCYVFTTMWQPIETAPKDGKIILVYGNDPFDEPAIMTARYEIDEWCRVCGPRIHVCHDDFQGDPDLTPTHWMPLPEPPVG